MSGALRAIFHKSRSANALTDEAKSPLPRRMIEDMTIRKLSPKTQQGYIRTIKNLAAFLGRSPDTASFEDIRHFQLQLATSGAGTPDVRWLKCVFDFRRI